MSRVLRFRFGALCLLGLVIAAAAIALILIVVRLDEPQLTTPTPVSPTPIKQELAVVVDNSQLVSYLLHKYDVAASEIKRLVQEKKKIQGDPPHPKLVSRSDQPSRLCKAQKRVSVATYNIWNINAPWPERRDRIVPMLRQLNADVIVFQEIRWTKKDHSQLDELAELLRSYPFKAYSPVMSVNQGIEEGLGILSRLPIVKTIDRVLSVEKSIYPARKCQISTIDASGVLGEADGLIDIFNTHISFQDEEQCTMVTQLRDIVESMPSNRIQVLLGDMNAYFDFPWPMDYLTGAGNRSFVHHALNPCAKYFVEHDSKPNLSSMAVPFMDAWEAFHGDWPLGLTFPNFQDERTEDPSRPDRILVRHPQQSKAVHVCSAQLFGQDSFFSSDVGTSIFPSDHKGVAVWFTVSKAT